MKKKTEGMLVVCGGREKAYLLRFQDPAARRSPALTVKQAVHRAALAYGRTAEGYGIFRMGNRLTYETFLAHVPEQTLEKYGLVRETISGSALIVEGRETVVSAQEAEVLREAEGSPMDRTEREWGSREAAVQMGMMWGIMSTLQNLDVSSLPVGCLSAWAEEFTLGEKDTQEKTLVDFFWQKLEGRLKEKEEGGTSDGVK